jgi:hypothetical protein
MAEREQLARPSDATSRRPQAPADKGGSEAKNCSSLLRLTALTITTGPEHQRRELERRAWTDRA